MRIVDYRNPSRYTKPSRTGIVIAAVPGVMMLALFYSLAIHMYQSLGGWPTSIGEGGFPPALVIHYVITAHGFSVLLLSVFFLPVLLVMFASVERLKRLTVYLAVYAGSVLLFFLLMQAAPSPFLNWWWD